MSELFDKGLKVRKEVLGEDYVNKSIAGADEFTRTMAEGATEFCWGAVWPRQGLDRRTRSIVNLAMLGALNRPHELKLHVKGALKNGVTKDEIKEILLQVAVYCGIPSGIDAFRNAREAFNDVEAGKGRNRRILIRDEALSCACRADLSRRLGAARSGARLRQICQLFQSAIGL